MSRKDKRIDKSNLQTFESIDSAALKSHGTTCLMLLRYLSACKFGPVQTLAVGRFEQPIREGLSLL